MHPATTTHNYLKKLARLNADRKVPLSVGLHHVDIRHDDWCDVFSGGFCNCEPDIRERPEAK